MGNDVKFGSDDALPPLDGRLDSFRTDHVCAGYDYISRHPERKRCELPLAPMLHGRHMSHL